MKNRLPYLSFIVVLGGTSALLAGTAQSQIVPPKQVVALQPSTPGTSQSGHVNVSGKITSGQLATGAFTLSGGSAGKVLTSDGSGAGTWQTPSIQAPYVLNGADLVPTFKATNSGIGYAIYGESSGSNTSAIRGVSTHTSLGYGVVGEGHGAASIGVVGLQLDASSTGAGVEGSTISSNGYGVRGINTSQGAIVFSGGVYGEAQGQGGDGVFGYSSSNIGTGRGVNGVAVALGAIGVLGSHVGDGTGVVGHADGFQGTGVQGLVNSSTSGLSPYAIKGLCNGQTGYGGYFRGPTALYAYSTNSGYAAHLDGAVRIDGNVGIGSLSASERLRVLGTSADVQSIINTGGGRGLFVQTNSDTGIWSTTGTGFAGVDGRTGSSGGYGVYGFNSNSGGTGSGVVGQTATGAGFGVYSFGNTGASGTKSFRIDHPLDPEGKYLLHYATESPTPQNFYSGNVVTDRNGKAWVELPAYFSEINANVKYQLTVVDDGETDTFVQAKIGRKVVGNRFLIMTSAPNVEVSWRIEADRNDAWVQQNGAPVEVEKPESIRGTYQHPELYGQPKERSEIFRLTGPKTKK